MKKQATEVQTCSVCGGEFARGDLVAGPVIREALREIIRESQPDWEPDGFVCQGDLKRIRSQHDYQVNLKAELEIRTLHQKVDHLLSHQWDRLVEIQNVQLEILSEIEGRK